MAAPVALLWLLVLVAPPAAETGTRIGGSLPGAPAPYHLRPWLVQYPDTAKAPVAADTTRVRPAAALEPDDDKPTRKSVLYTLGAIAVLTLTTLLLYNVRSR